MKKLLAIAVCCVTVGCGSRKDVQCIDGVEHSWHQTTFGSYGAMLPHYKPDGTLYTCENKYGN